MDIELRRPEPSDAAALFDLVAASDVAEVGYVDYELADAVEELTRPDLDPATDAWLAVQDGRAVGYGAATLRPGSCLVDVEVYVHPDAHVELYARLLECVRGRAAEHAATTADGEVLASAYASVSGTGRTASALARDGWQPVRRFARMSIDVDAQTTEPALPDGITLRRGLDADPADVHRVVMESFAGHFGLTPETFPDWSARQQSKAGHDRGLWLLADVDAEPAAALIGRHMTEQGWVAALGVRPRFRGRGLARMLLRTSLAQFAALGYPRVALGVDTANTTGAFRLYESVGMTRREAHDCYQIRIRATS